MRIRSTGLLLFLCAVLTGCEGFHYYSQAILGQVSILGNREPVENLLADEKTPEKLKNRFRLVLRIREFAEKEMKLPAKGHYRSYVDVERPYVVWNVFAAPEFSLEPETWCYPFVGCAAYRGYFSEENARRYAEKLKTQGYDVYVGGVTAYSTLGWFDDPLMNTFIYYPESGLAGLIFHELAHQVLYVPGDTAFNESFATLVEKEGLRRWFSSPDKKKVYDAYLGKRSCSRQFRELIMKYRDRLESLYGKEIEIEEKRRQKTMIMNALKKEYEKRKEGEKGCGTRDAWFTKPVNNARIASVSLYNDFVPAFQKILEESGGRLEKFYEESKALGKKPEAERRIKMKEIMGLAP